MKIPVVHHDIWKDLYDAAAKFQVLRPWEILEDDGFTTSVSRYHLGQQGWKRLGRTEPGLWESEGDDGRLGYSLPAVKKFLSYAE